jgi:hypothetical protein
MDRLRHAFDEAAETHQRPSNPIPSRTTHALGSDDLLRSFPNTRILPVEAHSESNRESQRDLRFLFFTPLWEGLFVSPGQDSIPIAAIYEAPIPINCSQ